MEIQVLCQFVTFTVVFLNLCECSIDLLFDHQCNHEVPNPRDVSQLPYYSYLCSVIGVIFTVSKLHYFNFDIYRDMYR